jgi:hypothetical protein
MEHVVQGLDVNVILTCTKCEDQIDETSSDPYYTGQDAIENNNWGYAANDILMSKLLCDTCLDAEEKDE